jgi:hypothetical protein
VSGLGAPVRSEIYQALMKSASDDSRWDHHEALTGKPSLIPGCRIRIKTLAKKIHALPKIFYGAAEILR